MAVVLGGEKCILGQDHRTLPELTYPKTQSQAIEDPAARFRVQVLVRGNQYASLHAAGRQLGQLGQSLGRRDRQVGGSDTPLAEERQRARGHEHALTRTCIRRKTKTHKTYIHPMISIRE